MAVKKSDSFASKMDRLEKIVTQMESDELDLEKAIALFEDGVKLSRECDKILTEAERKVEILVKDDTGNVTPAPFDPGLDEDEPES